MRMATRFFIGLAFLGHVASAADLIVETNFEGGSAAAIEIDHKERAIQLMPGGNPERGWPCWWSIRVRGIAPGETISLTVRASTATLSQPGLPLSKPLASSWGTPHQASYSLDGETWQHTPRGERTKDAITYRLQIAERQVYLAWGPPYTPRKAAKFVREAAAKCSAAQATELCRSREDRAVPMLVVREGDRPVKERLGIWVQARQHAWESGSSWVAQGFGEWLVSDQPAAGWLRQHAEIYLVPIMDIDNSATGNGGKEAQPQDHNRDWSEKPHWHEVAAAQKSIGQLIDEKRMSVFLDLHNPAPSDPTFFYVLPAEQLQPNMLAARESFLKLAHAKLGEIQPKIPLLTQPKPSGPGYHPLWRQISANWVNMQGNDQTVALCLETGWNNPRGTTEGYRAVGAALAESVQQYLQQRQAGR